MTSDIRSIQPNPYLFNIENRKKRKARLAHEIGAGAACLKCGDKCAGFQLHFWRKICQNCRCTKDDHNVVEDDEDIGQIVIGKLFERPIRTKEEELQYSFGTDLEMVNEATGKKEKLKFDWVPPGVANNIAKRYMEMLPPEKRPVAGTEAAKQRRRQLEQQIPLYDMDESERCENLPPEELQNFQKYIEDIRARVAGQASVQEIVPSIAICPVISSQSYSKVEANDHPNTDICSENDAYSVNNMKNNNMTSQFAHPQESFPNLTDSFDNMIVNQLHPNENKLPLSFSSKRGPTPYQQLTVLDSGISNLDIPNEPSNKQTIHPKGFRSVSPSVQARKPRNEIHSSNNLNQMQPSLKHLSAPQPYVANSYEQNIVPEQYSSNLTNKSPTKDSRNKDSHFSCPSIDPIDRVTSNEIARSLPNMVEREEAHVATSHAVQAPYSAQRETIHGPVSYAQESNVSVLFPHESQVLGAQTQLIQGPMDDIVGSMFSCQFCELSMIPGDVAVICERAGPGKYWHPQCFVCVTCKELLADLIYFYKDGQIFCGRDYTQAVDIPRCKACDELIFGDSWTRADSFDWHLHHYCCFVCDTPLAGMKYVPDEKGFPHCMDCHMSFKAKMCETCEDKISPSETRAGYRGYFYHATPNCFSCYNCHVSMIGMKFKMAKNWIFCSQDCIDASQQYLVNNPNPKEKPL